ncbi:MAG: 50S ribosomal protein L24 [Alphaproteobacteria bacterium]|jgi:large subunit ribosomal protein L24|nr:50S ribosomal protein L24 [Alphaproteobacteria bacterium]
MAARIRKGDRVVVLAGRYKGATGEVLRVIPKEERVVVQGVNVVKRHQRPNQMDPGGIKRFEAPIHVSNVAHVDPRDNKPTRVGFRFDEHGRKTRYAKRSGESIDV